MMQTFITSKKAKGSLRWKRLGFTLAELLAVIVIITFLAGATGGIYIGTYERRVLEKASRELLLAAKYARLIAIEQQKPCKMNLDDQKNCFYLTTEVLVAATSRPEEIVINNIYHRPVQLPEGVTFEDITIEWGEAFSYGAGDQPKIIVFAANGTASAAMVQIGNGKRHYTLSISPATARATLTFGAGDSLDADTIDLDLQ